MERKYGKKRLPEKNDPVESMLLVLLAPDVGEASARRAIKRLKNGYVDWNEVRVSQLYRIQQKMGLAPDDSASQPYAKLVSDLLNEIFLDRQGVNLVPMKDEKPSEIRAFLSRLTKIPKTAVRAIQLTAFGHETMALNAAAMRVTRRLGLVSDQTTVAAGQKAIEGALEGDQIYSFYWLIQEHARRFCTVDEPKCKTCPLRKRCARKGVD